MPRPVIELSQAQIIVVTLPDGKIEVTANGYVGKSRRIVRFELIPGQALSFASDIARALARAPHSRPSRH